MPTLDQYIKDIKQLKKELPAMMLRKAEAIAKEDGVALIQERVQGSGKDADGNAFSDYSESYKKKREKRGMQASFKDFTFTTEMWQQFGVVDKRITNRNIKIRLGGRNQDSQIKINANSKQEGISIIEISKSEEDQIIESFEEELFRILQAKL